MKVGRSSVIADLALRAFRLPPRARGVLRLKAWLPFVRGWSRILSLAPPLSFGDRSMVVREPWASRVTPPSPVLLGRPQAQGLASLRSGMVADPFNRASLVVRRSDREPCASRIPTPPVCLGRPQAQGLASLRSGWWRIPDPFVRASLVARGSRTCRFARSTSPRAFGASSGSGPGIPSLGCGGGSIRSRLPPRSELAVRLCT